MQSEAPFWQPRYRVTAPIAWQGRRDGPDALRFHEVIKIVDLRNSFEPVGDHRFGFIGFACDEGILRNQGRVGAAIGPQVLRKAFGKFAYPYKNGVSLYDLGDIVCVDHDLEASQKSLAAVVAHAVKHGVTPIVFGGGHEVAWGLHQGLLQALPDEALGVMSLDAHFDLRTPLEGPKGTSGSSFMQIAEAYRVQNKPFHYLVAGIQRFSNTHALFETAKELNVQTILADTIQADGVEVTLPQINSFAQSCDKFHLTLCLDVLAAAFAPGVSSPQPTGLLPWHIESMLRYAIKTGRVAGFDVAELSPGYDQDGRTAGLAALLVATAIDAWVS